MSSNDGPPLDDHQYTVAGLASYEAIYGRDFVSPGGRTTTAELLATLPWSHGCTALDVGCGLGGAAFMMATEHSADVLGIDLSKNMIDEAIKRCDDYGLSGQVTLRHGDILTLDLPHRFDIIHSREVFLHIHDKPTLFKVLHNSLNPGGSLLFTDYCCGGEQPSDAFREYLDEFGYDLRTVDEIGSLLSNAGLSDVVATDMTAQFIEIHEREIDQLENTSLTEADQQELRTGWLAKIDRAERGEQRWGRFEARAAESVSS